MLVEQVHTWFVPKHVKQNPPNFSEERAASQVKGGWEGGWESTRHLRHCINALVKTSMPVGLERTVQIGGAKTTDVLKVRVSAEACMKHLVHNLRM